MDNQYYDFVGKYENRDIQLTLKSGESLTGYVELTFPADEDDTNRVSFALNVGHKIRDLYVDDILTIREI